MAELFNIQSIYVRALLCMRVATEVCEGEMFFGPFESKDDARAWAEGFIPTFERCWKGGVIPANSLTEAGDMLSTLKSSAEEPPERAITASINWWDVGGIERGKAKAIKGCFLNPKSFVKVEELLVAVLFQHISNVSACLMSAFK